MGDEKKDYEIWLDEYNQTMGDVTIDLSDYGAADDVITISGLDMSNTYIDYSDWIIDTQNPKHDDIVLTGGGEEMLRVEKDGFYVRGVKVEADDKEAKQVYEAFKQWLAWATLSKNDEE